MRQLAGLIEVVLPPFGSREARYAVPTSFRVLPARARGKPGLPPLATVEELASALHAYVDAAPRAVLHGLWQRTRAAAGTVPGEAAIDGGNRLNTPSFFDLPRDDADGIAQFRQEHRPPIDDAERFQFIPAGALRGDPRGARPGSHRRRRRGRTWLTSLALILVGFAIGLAGAQYYLGHGGAEPLLQAIEARAPWVAGTGERWLREVGRVLKVDRREEPRSSETVAPGASSEAPPNHFSQAPAPDPNMPDSGAAPEPAAQPVKTSGTK
jgi:hypothetical protein